MNTQLNKSDWILLKIVFATTILLGCMDYYQSGNKFIEYVVDFPTSTVLSITIILIFIQKIVPQFLVEQKTIFYSLFLIYYY
jgi:two-component system LytT family sensor kinase